MWPTTSRPCSASCSTTCRGIREVNSRRSFAVANVATTAEALAILEEIIGMEPV